MQHVAKRKRMPARQWKREREIERLRYRQPFANETVRKINMRRVPNIYAICRPFPIEGPVCDSTIK